MKNLLIIALSLLTSLSAVGQVLQTDSSDSTYWFSSKNHTVSVQRGVVAYKDILDGYSDSPCFSVWNKKIQDEVDAFVSSVYDKHKSHAGETLTLMESDTSERAKLELEKAKADLSVSTTYANTLHAIAQLGASGEITQTEAGILADAALTILNDSVKENEDSYSAKVSEWASEYAQAINALLVSHKEDWDRFWAPYSGNTYEPPSYANARDCIQGVTGKSTYVVYLNGIKF